MLWVGSPLPPPISVPFLSSCHEMGAPVLPPDLYSCLSTLLATLLTSLASKSPGPRRLPVLRVFEFQTNYPPEDLPLTFPPWVI